MKRIVMTGGGTSGHVTPNIALLPYFKENGWEIHYIGSKGGMEKQLIENEGIFYHAINSGKLRRYLDLKNLTDVFKVLIGFFQALALLIRLRPNVVFSKGGFVSCPVVWAAWFCGIPSVIHESDYTPGLTNKLTIPFAKKICYSFTETKKYISTTKAILTGIPIRRELFEGDKAKGRKICGFKDDKPVILVTGGSQGAEKINLVVRENLNRLLPKYNICHLCGKGNILREYELFKGYKQFEYISEELPHIFSLSDLVISRAGATTIFELLELRKPMILIPLSKKASRGDQILNAESFKDRSFCEVIDEDTITANALLETIERTISNKEKYIKAMKSVQTEKATEKVIEVILSQI
jgi:UDP-N-acetylglucosamine--N-acetylmuramyl-(pentapeptide) pyrophosphoryl-undecaprenol N-acetylglucosamine transferase